MKIVEKFLARREAFRRNFVLFKGVLLLLCTVGLIICFIPSKHRVKNHDFSIRGLEYEKFEILKTKTVDFIKKGEHLEFNTNPVKGNRHTILIIGKLENLELLKTIAAEMIESKIKRHNFRFISSDKLVNLNFYSFFCVIKILNDHPGRIEYPFFAQVMPNSDFLFTAANFFSLKPLFRLKDFLYHSESLREYNVLHLGAIHQHLFQIKRLLRCLSNADAFTFGTSFYFTTTQKWYIFLNFIPFFVFISLFYLADLLIYEYEFRFPWPVLYVFSPLVSLLFLNDHSTQMPFHILFFMSINYKFAFIFTFCAYLRAIKEFVCLYRNESQKNTEASENTN